MAGRSSSIPDPLPDGRGSTPADGEEADRFLRALEKAVRLAPGGPLFCPGDGVLVACSGGPDSTALAFALAALDRRAGLSLRLEIGHFHHGLRGASAECDLAFAQEVARRLGLPFHFARGQTRDVQARCRGSLEEVARDLRYAFLAETARARGLARVATAHHRDDLVETVLLRVLRGTGIRGLCGIPARRRLGGAPGPEVVRPFLTFPRARLRRYLATLGIQAREDESNLLPALPRNRLRLEILPLLRSAFPSFDVAVARLARLAAEASEFLEAEAARLLDAALVAPRLPLELPLAAIREAPPPLRALLLLRAIERATGLQLCASHAEALAALAQRRGSGAEAHLPRGLVARRTCRTLTIESRSAAESAEAPPVAVLVPGRTEAPAFGVAVETRETVPSAAPFPPEARAACRSALAARTAAHRALFDLAALRFPLELRGPRPGDAFYPLGLACRKKLQDYFVDAKIPRRERPAALLLTSAGEIAWIVGLRLDSRFAATAHTARALEVRVEPRLPEPPAGCTGT